jgi:hypothetical protein
MNTVYILINTGIKFGKINSSVVYQNIPAISSTVYITISAKIPF